MRTVTAAAVAVLLAVVWLPSGGQSSPLPPACSDGRLDVPRAATNCMYGWTVDKCGKRVCLKGPGEMCGGKYGRSALTFHIFPTTTNQLKYSKTKYF